MAVDVDSISDVADNANIISGATVDVGSISSAAVQVETIASDEAVEVHIISGATVDIVMISDVACEVHKISGTAVDDDVRSVGGVEFDIMSDEKDDVGAVSDERFDDDSITKGVDVDETSHATLEIKTIFDVEEGVYGMSDETEEIDVISGNT